MQLEPGAVCFYLEGEGGVWKMCVNTIMTDFGFQVIDEENLIFALGR